MIKNLLLSVLVLCSVVMVSCSKSDDDEATKKNEFTFDAGDKHYDYSTNVEGFTNLNGTYTIKAALNDTVYVYVVIPSLKTGTYQLSDKDGKSSVSFHNGSKVWYDSEYGTEKNYTIQITSVTNSYAEGAFSGKLGSLSTYMGFASDYLVITNGKFGFNLK